jgi:hypothetical protein
VKRTALERRTPLQADSRHRWQAHPNGEECGAKVCQRCGQLWVGGDPPARGCSGMKRSGKLRHRGRRAVRDYGSRVFGPLCTHVRRLPCCTCGATAPSDPHHVRSRGAGFGDWLPDGDGNVVPLCRRHHDAAGELNVERFARQYGVDLAEVARRIGRAYTQR